MRGLALAACAAAVAVAAASAVGRNDTALVYAHVRDSINQTFRGPAGVLAYPYLVPAGPYQTCWDWDSLFLSVASRPPPILELITQRPPGRPLGDV